MATRTWIFLINTFRSNTKRNVKNALSLTVDHLAKLTANEADDDILAIKAAYQPVHDAFITAYNQLQSRQGLYHGKTQTFEEMLKELANVKINEWRGQVFSVFPEGTSNATAIFPQNREPFQKGAYDERVEAVHTLATTLATYTTQAGLVALSATVQAYYITLTGARAMQQTDEGSVNTLRTNLKAAQALMCVGLYRNLGKLMAKYAETPEAVANYYDLGMLRYKADETEPVFSNNISGGGTIVNFNEVIGEEGIEITKTTVLRITNKSTNAAPLIIYAGSSATAGPGSAPQFTVNPGETLIKTVAELTSEGNELINVQNNSPFTAAWQIEIIPPD